jgi:predicted DNA-binding transcriptional regulator AlpA
MDNSYKEIRMQVQSENEVAKTAGEKLACGALLSLAEVAALLGVTPATIHRLPLQSIRLGRQYRFDPKDVTNLIDRSKEAI